MKRAAFIKSPQVAMIVAATVALMVLAFFIDYPFAYLMVALASILPGILWLRTGALGIPILPILSVVYFLYYAVPIARNNIPDYADDGDVMRAAATIALFLFVASLPGLVLRPNSRRALRPGRELNTRQQVVRLIFFGLALNISFFVLLFAGWLTVFGGAVGVVRSISIGAGAVSCFLLGYCSAAGVLHGARAWIAGIVLSVLFIMELSTLFLVGAALSMLSVLFGYVITARRIPWAAVIASTIALSILHLGKFEMREKYWLWQTNYSSEISLVDVPVMMVEWVGYGIIALFDPNDTGQSAVDRAALLFQLVEVQRLAPDIIPYVDGESYALLPQMLVPRFLEPDKIASQASMVLLNVHFGFQTTEDAGVTAIGWGIIAEAFANFGMWGVFGAGLVYGTLCWLFTFWSAGSSPLSLRNLLAIVALGTFMNVEMDFPYLVSSLWQALVAGFGFYLASKLFIGEKKGLPLNSIKAVGRGMHRGTSETGVAS
jgi:hypothetical protein